MYRCFPQSSRLIVLEGDWLSFSIMGKPFWDGGPRIINPQFFFWGVVYLLDDDDDDDDDDDEYVENSHVDDDGNASMQLA